MFTKVKGFRDIFGEDIRYWHLVEQRIKATFPLYGYEEVKLPILEKTELFARGIGETTDIVEKEMFTFKDRDGTYLSLRPEGTASIVRCFIENRLYEPPAVRKYYYYGPMFRRERPQKGRFRQFYQIGIEAFGAHEPLIDAEIIYLLYKFLTSFNIEDFLQMEINSIGCPNCRPKYRKELIKYLNSHKETLCKDCNNRLERNPMRVLDCKVDTCKKITKDAPVILDHLCDECKNHFEHLLKYLDTYNFPYKINPKIVRGLDYYVRTAFEMTTDKLGASSAVGAGGRYDGLIKELGGPDIPGVGFAIGVDRLVELIKLKNNNDSQSNIDCYLITFKEFSDKGITIAEHLREKGIKTVLSYDFGSIKSEMKKANRLKAKSVLILGENEIKENSISLKNMDTGEQKLVKIDELINEITKIINNKEA